MNIRVLILLTMRLNFKGLVLQLVIIKGKIKT